MGRGRSGEKSWDRLFLPAWLQTLDRPPPSPKWRGVGPAPLSRQLVPRFLFGKKKCSRIKTEASKGI